MPKGSFDFYIWSPRKLHAAFMIDTGISNAEL
jgi:hypothetical protein